MYTVFLRLILVVEMTLTIDSAQLIPFVYFLILGLILLCVGHCVFDFYYCYLYLF